MRRTEQRRRAVFALYQHQLTGRPEDELLGVDDTSFTRELVHGTLAHASELDELIGSHAHGWDVDRIAPLDRNLLRVAVFELTSREDVPNEVAIDEAVELAKRYCGADAPGFVNGILGSILRQIESGDSPGGSTP